MNYFLYYNDTFDKLTNETMKSFIIGNDKIEITIKLWKRGPKNYRIDIYQEYIYK